MNLGEDELAVRVGGSANKALFEHYEQEAEASGSASKQALIEEDAHVVFDGNFDSHPVLRRLSGEPGTRALIAAPILVCTVDHLVPATESTRGGRQIVPMLRLMSSDLVLDEIDDFDINDLPALTRLVNWAGLLGSRCCFHRPPCRLRWLKGCMKPTEAVVKLFNAIVANQAWRWIFAVPGSTSMTASMKTAPVARPSSRTQRFCQAPLRTFGQKPSTPPCRYFSVTAVEQTP